MRIAEAAALSGLSPRQIRYYAERGFLPDAGRSRGRHRKFTERDISRLTLLKVLLAADVPLRLIDQVVHGRADAVELARVDVLLGRHAAASQRARSELGLFGNETRRNQPDISLMFDIYVLRTRMNAFLTSGLAAAGLSSTEYAVLSLVRDAHRTAPELAHLLGAPTPTLNRQLAEMIRRGWMLRVTDPASRRRLISLTTEGERHFQEALPLAAAVAADLDHGLRRRGADPDRVRELLQTLSAAVAD